MKVKTKMEINTSISEKYIKLTTYLLGFISFVLIVYILMALKEILLPVTIAIFMTFLFSPVVLFLGKYKIPRWLAIIFILVVITGVYYLLVLILISSFSSFPDKMQLYIMNLSAFLENLLQPFDLTVKEVAVFFNIDVQDFKIGSVLEHLFSAGIIQDVVNSITSFLGSFFIALIFWVFMILGKLKFEERLRVAFSGNSTMIEQSVERIDKQLQSYITIKTILSLLTGAITMIILMAFGIDFAIVWGILTFILNYIPNVGSLIATIAPITVALLEYGLGVKTISITVLLLLNQNIIGNLIEPHYLGRQMDLSPVFVLFSLIFWGWVWGIVGMFLAVPIAAVMKILFSNIEGLKPVAILMGRTVEPLEPPENL